MNNAYYISNFFVTFFKVIFHRFFLYVMLIISECRSCFHKTCPMPDQCPKCARIKFRYDYFSIYIIRITFFIVTLFPKEHVF